MTSIANALKLILPAWGIGFWLIYGLLVFGVSALFGSLLATATFLVLLSAPLYAVTFLVNYYVWTGSLSWRSDRSIATLAVKGMLRVLLWALPIFVALIACALLVQPHIFKAAGDLELPFALWPTTPPSVAGVSGFVILALIGLIIPVQLTIRRGWNELRQIDQTKATGPSTRTGSGGRRLLAAVAALLVLSNGLLVLIDGPSWKNWVWPIGGTLKNAEKVTHLWDYYDRSKPWSVGGVRYLIPKDWHVEIVTAGSNLQEYYYQVIALTAPRASALSGQPEPPPVERIFIHNRLADLLTIEPGTPDSEYRCKRAWRFGLTACWHRDRPTDQDVDTSDYDYAASLRWSSDTEYDPSIERQLGQTTVRDIRRESLYIVSDDPAVDFLARCQGGVCRWIFIDQQTEHEKSTIEVRFAQTAIKDWLEIRSQVKGTLTRFKEAARAYAN